MTNIKTNTQSHLSSLIEKLKPTQLLNEHLTNNDLINYLQSAYKINLSIETIFIDLTNCIANSIKQYDYIMPILLDISTE